MLRHAGEPAHVVGWSSGGNTALALAVKAPELVRSLVVVEAPFHGLRHAIRSMLSGLAAAKVAQLRGRPEQGAAAFARWASGLGGGGNRKVRYRGIEKNNAWLHTRTAALNLRRLLKLGLVRQDGTWVLA